jgi:hypothetical protein
MMEGREIDLRLGTKGDHPKFRDLAGEYAMEIVRQSVEEVIRGVDSEGEGGGKPHAHQGFKRFGRTQIIEEGCMAYAYHAYPSFTSAN